MVGSGSAAYGQGWEMDAIAACVVGGVSFTGGIGKISGVVFSFTTMTDAWLLNSAFRSMAWGGLQGKSGVFQPFGKIKNCAFRYNDFSGMALNGFDWTGAELQQCTFDDTRLAGASFYGVRLGRTRFTRCDLQKADLRTAEEYAIDLETNKLKGARFSFPDVVRLLDGTGIVIE